MTDNNSDTALPGAVEVARLNQTASNEEMRSLRLVLDEIRQLRASQVDILALLQQKSDSKADLADPRKLSQSLAQKFKANITDEMEDAIMDFWEEIFPTKENIFKSLERWVSFLHQDPQLITKFESPPLYDCQLVAEDGTISRLTSLEVGPGEFKQRLEALWAKFSPPPIGAHLGGGPDPKSSKYLQIHQAMTDRNGLPLLREGKSKIVVGNNKGIEV
jgi:hypothetical protein